MKTFIASAFAFLMAFSAVSVYAEKVDISKVKCLISGAAAKEDKAADWKDGKVYFCCGNCLKKFNDDSKSFAAKANHQLIASGQVTQGACPFSGGALNKDASVEFKGAKVGFCCNNCKGKAEKFTDDEKLDKLFGDAAFEKAKFVKAESK